MSKKLISILLTFAFFMSFMTGCSAAGQTENIQLSGTETEKAAEFVLKMQIGTPIMTVNGEEKQIDEQGTVPVIENDRTLVPIRAIIEAMGGDVKWDSETNTAVLTLGDDIITLNIGSETAFFNEEKHTLDVAPKIINDRTMLPIRFIAESFKFGVDWDEKTETITITKDTPDNSAAAKPDTSKGGKTLVVYYSASGSTAKVAEYIKNAANADIFELEPVDKYSDADLNWTNSSSRVNAEHEDESKRNIKLKSTTVPNWEDYDTVFIGYPIWWGIAAWPVNNFVKNNDFSGKTVIPFCTSASSGLGQSGALLEEMAGTGDWQDGKRFRSGASESDVTDWVKTLDLPSPSETANENSSLVVYFSQPETDNPDNMTQEEDNSTVVIDGKVLGNTQYMAQVIAENTNSDIFKIEPSIPYPTDHTTLVNQASEEKQDKPRPAIKNKIENLDKYDTIYIGYPNWWGDMPMILYAFFESYDFSGKTIITFNTHGGSGFSNTVSTIRSLEPDANVIEGLSISRDHIQDAEQKIVEWVTGLQ